MKVTHSYLWRSYSASHDCHLANCEADKGVKQHDMGQAGKKIMNVSSDGSELNAVCD